LIKPERGVYMKVDNEGHLVIPSEVASRYGMKPGRHVLVSAGPNGLNICRSPESLAKLYIEPTNQCNLNCRTCMRHVWDEPMGKMSDMVFARVMEGLRAFSPPPQIFFGGFGEPLFHPKIVAMVAQAKSLGSRVELITNGTMLTADLSGALINNGLDMLWVSLDGATPQSYADMRLGAALPQVLENLSCFTRLRKSLPTSSSEDHPCTDEEFSSFGSGDGPGIQLGIEFVAMKRNIDDLPAVIDIGQRFGAERFIVTNVLPYTKELIDETLYRHTPYSSGYSHLSLPAMNVNDITYTPLYQAMRKLYGTWANIGSETDRNYCPFINNGAGAIRWDGNLSPCLPLMHSHPSYLDYLPNVERFQRHWTIGNVTERSLPDLWNTPEHMSFRQRVQAFDFPPCTACGSGEFFADNEHDCYGNTFPTCGGCLWAQGVIRCP